MASQDFVWMIGGPQGSGVDSAANIFARACCYGGLHVYGEREYHSNIKGLHSYFHMRISKREVRSRVDFVNLLCTFDAESVVRHVWDVAPKGGIICDEAILNTKIMNIPTLPPPFLAEFQKTAEKKEVEARTVSDLLKDAERTNVRIYAVPYMELLKDIAKQIDEERLSKLTRMINVLSLGISFGLLDFDKAMVKKAVSMVFAKKPRIIVMNMLALDKAYEYVEQEFGGDFGYKLETVQTDEKRILVSGFEAVALGKLLGGCRVQTYYPITPAADESVYLEANEIFDLVQGTSGEEKEGSIVVMQTEDEIAAINMASGAALAGARTATSTSGPGFSLMVEGLGWAGMNEVPVVINYYQRGAPSTGLPTRHGQDDLKFAIHASHGEFPRIVLASGDTEECFYDAIRAFNYAEKYQMPVIHLIDKAIANSTRSCKIFDTSRAKIDRGQLRFQWEKTDRYKRFEFTESGISPRIPLGTPNAVFWNTGNEHDEFGHTSEEPLNRTRMMEKRMRKLELVDREIPIEERVSFFGAPEASVTIVSWGSPKGAILDAMKRLSQEGWKVNFLQIRMVHPFPKEHVSEVLNRAGKRIDVEMNYSGQLASIIREQTGVVMDNYVLKYSGLPMSSDEVYNAIKLILQEKAPKRQVLPHGS
ncbi:MAG: 2-oxoacid:ferredoxin oxidoreductase subunit alpha [Candidatus Bathyarchaeota archaeon]|nr:2-oxoacid:ferredoxin oxidoreductase subunit alpha [Candidatus Bathyarchaeota archaeon]